MIKISTRLDFLFLARFRGNDIEGKITFISTRSVGRSVGDEIGIFSAAERNSKVYTFTPSAEERGGNVTRANSTFTMR